MGFEGHSDVYSGTSHSVYAAKYFQALSHHQVSLDSPLVDNKASRPYWNDIELLAGQRTTRQKLEKCQYHHHKKPRRHRLYFKICI